MATAGHTYGPSCLLQPESNTFTRRASEASSDAPLIKPHYFYCSALPIDDPLSPVPPPPTGTTAKQKLPPRPFSVPDNASLEDVWLSINAAGKEKGPSLRPHNDGPLKEKLKPTESAATSSVNNLTKIFKESKDGLSKVGKSTKKKDVEKPPSEAEESSAPRSAESRGKGIETSPAANSDMNALGEQDPPALDSSHRYHQPKETKTSEREKKVKKSARATKTIEEEEATLETLETREETGSVVQPPNLQQKATQALNKAKVSGQEEPGWAAERIQPDLTLCDDPDHIPFDETMPVGIEEIGNDEFEGNVQKRRGRNPFRMSHKKDKDRSKSRGEAEVKDEVEPEAEISSYRRLSASTQKAHDSKQKSHSSRQKSRDSKQKDKDGNLGSSPAQHDTTGTPFLRIPTASKWSRSRSRSPETQSEIAQADGEGVVVPGEKQKPVFSKPSPHRLVSAQQSGDGQNKQTPSAPVDHASEGRWGFFKHDDGRSSSRKEQKKPQEVYVTVGVSRLHVVEMRSLKMGPIYWDPVHDISSVVRGTWFYKETMWPVESDVANQIEEGYEYIKPWTPTYVDELNSCQEVGPEAELKLVHRLWPAQEPAAEGAKSAANKVKKELLSTASDQLDEQGQEQKNAIKVAGLPSNRAAGVLDGYDDPVRLFSKCSMIYVNARDAQILRPNQLPSAARGRKPLAAIRKGRPIGIPVVRGFDFKAWERLYPPPKMAGLDAVQKPREGGSRSLTAASREVASCNACLSADERPKPTDLIMIIHGIGQKLSERVESFNFTHSINAFRRQVNMEMEAESVKPWLREGFGGIMVLPINWRSKIQLDESAPADPKRKEAPGSTRNEFALKDITEDSIPAVRNLISDVLLDIPYYMSHHKPKMIEAVIKEANRVYRLWCNNNPGFHENGRVHIVAHSLGSVMSLDILSKQPTKLPKQLNFKTSKIRSDVFEFDTKNLFFAGSPVGLFLYINRATLLPRTGRDKPGADGEGSKLGVTGEAGTFGCLAVDNLYNIMHYIDPIAYRLNATVDVDYAASLKVADVPSTTATWGQYFGFKSKAVLPTDATKALTTLENFQTRPSVQSMPSTVEMETHNFTREEIAEKRMFLLNDNGQIDFTLRSGGGPLDIAYLNMLGAHSSYWNLQDFVRFLVVEIGRKPGKEDTVASIKAVKKSRNKK